MSKLQMVTSIITFVMLLLFASGCTGVRTDGENGAMLGIWLLSNEQQHQLVADVLRDHGLHATIDTKGLTVNADDQMRATEILLTDHRMKESNLMIFAIVSAGSGVRTKDGITATVLMPAADAGVK